MDVRFVRSARGLITVRDIDFSVSDLADVSVGTQMKIG